MDGSLTPSELTGLLDSVSLDRGSIPISFTGPARYEGDSLANARIQNRIHLSPTGFGAEVAKHLRHIPVNPHNETVSELLRRSYVYSPQEPEAPAVQILNRDDESLLKFMSTVIDSAVAERLFSINPEPSNSTTDSLFHTCVHVISGERGVGKTFFLNYALTRCNEILDKQKIVWVRLNFVYKSGFEDDLERWMHAQAAKIILRYYDKKSTYGGKKVVSAADWLFDWIGKNERFDDSERKRLRASLRTMEQVFGRLGEDEAIRPSLCDKELCRELYSLMRKDDWSFIFVLDGFDQLDISPDQVNHFELIRLNLERFISMRAKFGAAIVIVTRSNTFDDLKSYDPFKGIPEIRKYKVADVDFEKVVRTRFDAIKEVIIRRIPPHRRASADALETTIQKFIDSVLTPKELREANEKMNISNTRAQLQTLYLMFLDFVDETTGKGYLILEHMLLNGMRYPANAYSYHDISQNELTARSDELTHEARFLPLITRYPLPALGGPFVFPRNAFAHILLGLRILQLCVAARDLRNSQDFVSFGELTGILSAAFGYLPSIQSAMIDEMGAFDMLRIIRSNGLPAKSSSNRIVALPKADHLLEERLNDVAYLNMCALRTSFPRHLFDEGFVQCAYLGTGDHDGQRWAMSKIANAIFLFTCLSYQNRFERAQVDTKKIERFSDREKAIWSQAIRNGLWDLIPNARQQLVVEVMQILGSGPLGWLTIEDKEEVAERVRRIFTMWRSEPTKQSKV